MTTSIFLSIAVVCAAARAVIRIFYLKRTNVDDYFFFLAVVTLIPGQGLLFCYTGILYEIEATIEGKATPPPNVLQKLYNAAPFATTAELLCWTAIFSVKFSFLFYFRALVDRLYNMQVLWWITFAVLVPATAVSIAGTIIVCPYRGSSVSGMLNFSL